MVKARKTMRHLKKKGKMGKKGASRVGKSARRRTTKHQRRTRRRMKLRGGMNKAPGASEGSEGLLPPVPAQSAAQPAGSDITKNITELKAQVAAMEEKVKEIGSAPITCTVGNVEGK